MQMDKKTKSLLIRLTKEEHKKIKLEATERGLSISTLIKQALLSYIANYNRE
jgi:predicted HicB family RNase H-like nuclease